MPEYSIIDDINTSPFPALAHLSTKRSFWRYRHGSGVLINNNFILTAGHNLLSRGLDTIKKVTVTLGRNVNQHIWESQRLYVGATQVAEDFRYKNFPRDFAIIYLGDNRPDINSSFRLPNTGEIANFVNGGKTLYLAGYPGETHGGKTPKIASSNSSRIDGGLIYYDINTAKGNSGGPVWFEHNGEFILAGIHVAEGVDGKAVLIDGDVFDEITSWISGVIL